MENERIDEIADEAWRMYDYYRGFLFTGSRRLAIERVATFAYREGLKDAGAKNIPLQDVSKGPVKVVFEQHKSLLMSIITAAISATGAAAVTTNANGWIATGGAWAVAVLAILAAGVKSWVKS